MNCEADTFVAVESKVMLKEQNYDQHVGGDLRKTLFCLSIALMLAPSMAYAGFFDSNDQWILDAGGSISTVAPDWKIVCLGEGKDEFGEVTTHKHCRLEKDDFYALVVVTSRGISIPLRHSRAHCMGFKSRLTVDSRSITKEPLREQLDALSRGTTFSRSYQALGISCDRLTEFTGLDGFPEALSNLKMWWKKFK